MAVTEYRVQLSLSGKHGLLNLRGNALAEIYVTAAEAGVTKDQVNAVVLQLFEDALGSPTPKKAPPVVDEAAALGLVKEALGATEVDAPSPGLLKVAQRLGVDATGKTKPELQAAIKAAKAERSKA